MDEPIPAISPCVARPRRPAVFSAAACRACTGGGRAVPTSETGERGDRAGAGMRHADPVPWRHRQRQPAS